MVLAKAILEQANRNVSSHFGPWCQAFWLQGETLTGDPSSSALNFPTSCPYQQLYKGSLVLEKDYYYLNYKVNFSQS